MNTIYIYGLLSKHMGVGAVVFVFGFLCIYIYMYYVTLSVILYMIARNTVQTLYMYCDTVP